MSRGAYYNEHDGFVPDRARASRGCEEQTPNGRLSMQLRQPEDRSPDMLAARPRGVLCAVFKDGRSNSRRSKAPPTGVGAQDPRNTRYLQGQRSGQGPLVRLGRQRGESTVVVGVRLLWLGASPRERPCREPHRLHATERSPLLFKVQLRKARYVGQRVPVLGGARQ